MSDYGNFFLSNENLAADGALLTFGKTCFCTGSCLAGDYFLGMLCAKLFFTCITDIVAVLVLVSECCCKLCVTYSTCLCCGTGSCCACGMAESLALSLTALALLRLGAGRIRPGVNVGSYHLNVNDCSCKSNSYYAAVFVNGKLIVAISCAATVGNTPSVILSALDKISACCYIIVNLGIYLSLGIVEHIVRSIGNVPGSTKKSCIVTCNGVGVSCGTTIVCAFTIFIINVVGASRSISAPTCCCAIPASAGNCKAILAVCGNCKISRLIPLVIPIICRGTGIHSAEDNVLPATGGNGNLIIAVAVVIRHADPLCSTLCRVHKVRSETSIVLNPIGIRLKIKRRTCS